MFRYEWGREQSVPGDGGLAFSSRFDIGFKRMGMQVDVEGNLVNAYVSSKIPGRVELERIGNIKDIKEIPISGIADISMDTDGTVMWAFTDSEEKLKINPLALVQQDDDVRLPLLYWTTH